MQQNSHNRQKSRSIPAPLSTAPQSFVLKGDVVYCTSPERLESFVDSYLVFDQGVSQGVYPELPECYRGLALYDYSGHLIIPGLIDLHTHAPQYSIRGVGGDRKLLEWLGSCVYPEEVRYADFGYAQEAYGRFVCDLAASATTRAVVFATVHVPATLALMDLLEQSGMISLVGKVNMDRNSYPGLEEPSAEASLAATRLWLTEAEKRRYQRTGPVLTPRFIPACSDQLLAGLRELQSQTGLALQSHLSENRAEVAWAKRLCPESDGYADAFLRRGLLGADGALTVMAHCVYSNARERALLKERGVFIAHCPESNTNLMSGIAPVRECLDEELHIGLGSDVAGGSSLSLFRSLAMAIQASKLRHCHDGQGAAPLTVVEAFYLATIGGGRFWGKVGSFQSGYEFDAVVIKEAEGFTGPETSIDERLERLVYLDQENQVVAKFVQGKPLFI